MSFPPLFCQVFSKIRRYLSYKVTRTELNKQLLVFTVRRSDSFWLNLQGKEASFEPTVCRSHEVRCPSTDFQDSNLIGAPMWMRSKNGAHSLSFHPSFINMSSPFPTYQSRFSSRSSVSLALSSLEPSNGLC